MKVNVRGKNKYVPTQDVKIRAEEKIQKLNQYFRRPDDLQAEVVCKAYEAYEVVEVTIPTKNIILRAEVKAETVLSAIDLAIDKLETQMRRHKDKIESSIKRRGGVKEHYSQMQDNDLDVERIDPLENLKTLVKEKQIILEPMDREEAILAMEMSGHDFYMYLDKSTHKTAVVYLRNDGNYGVIESR